MSASSLPLPQGKSVSLKQFVSRHINEIGLLVVIAILYLVFSLNAPGFISLNNQMNVLRDDAPRDKCTLSCAINGIHAAFHYLKKNYISGCVMTVPTG